MNRLTRHELAFASATDVANRRAGKNPWSREDYNAAVAEYDRLNPLTTEGTMKKHWMRSWKALPIRSSASCASD